MKNNMMFRLLTLMMFTVLFSCGSDSPNVPGDDGGGENPKIDLNKSYRELFAHNAVRDGVEFMNELISLNKRIDATTLYTEEEYNRFYTKKIALPTGEVSIQDWTASSSDLFHAQPELQTKVKNQFDASMLELIQLRKDIQRKNQEASPGNYGFVGSQNVTGDIRYVDGKAIELAEVGEKQIMGIVLLDQIINHHLGNNVMKSADLRKKNSERKFMSGKQYTELEYHWDMAYSLVGLENREVKPYFIANYLINEFQGADFLKGVDKRVFDAFKKGRMALSKSDYDTADEQIKIIRESISKLYAARAVHYLKQARQNLLTDMNSPQYHKAFHPLSEVYGFMLAFVSTRKADGSFYVQDYSTIEQMTHDFIGEQGFWEQDRLLGDENTPGSLENMSKRIGELFGFDHNQVI